jgi:hypothetical protein
MRGGFIGLGMVGEYPQISRRAAALLRRGHATPRHPSADLETAVDLHRLVDAIKRASDNGREMTVV